MEQEERIILALNTLKDFSFGTLWWIIDTEWKKAMPDFVERPDRHNHLGVSLRTRALDSIADILPMLLGGSEKHGKSFSAVGLTEGKGKHKTTFFRLRTIDIPCVIMKDEGLMGENKFKPSLSSLEKKQLRAYLAKKGVKYAR